MATEPEDFTPAASEPAGTGGGGTNRAQLLLIGAIVVVLLAVVYFLFLSGGGEEEQAVAPTEVPTEEVEPTKPPKKTDGGQVETFEVFAPKDPFDPLVSESTGGGGGGEGTGTGDVDGVEPIGGPGGVDEGPGTAPEPGQGGGNVGGHTVALIDVFRNDAGNQSAQVEVDGTVYTVVEGDRFADNFEVLSISGTCATMLFGDDQFTLCEGESILK